MSKKHRMSCWITEGRYSDGWAPLPGAPASDVGRRFVLRRGLDWAARNLPAAFFSRAGNLKRRDIRVAKYVRSDS